MGDVVDYLNTFCEIEGTPEVTRVGKPRGGTGEYDLKIIAYDGSEDGCDPVKEFDVKLNYRCESADPDDYDEEVNADDLPLDVELYGLPDMITPDMEIEIKEAIEDEIN